MNLKKILFLSLMVLTVGAAAQSKRGATVSGYITDLNTGETLIGAGVLSDHPDRTRSGAVTNVYGY